MQHIGQDRSNIAQYTARNIKAMPGSKAKQSWTENGPSGIANDIQYGISYNK